MTTLVALGFPAVAVLVVWGLLWPGVIRSLPPVPLVVDASPLPLRTHYPWAVAYLVLSFGGGWGLAAIQRVLLASASGGANWAFTWRASDLWVYPLIPGLFLGMIVGFPIQLRILYRYYGERLAGLVDRAGRDRSGLSMRQEIALGPKLAAGFAVFGVLLNAAAFDTYLQVGGGVVRYSSFFALGATQHALADVKDMVVHSKTVAPNGRANHKRHLELRLKDGSRVDTYYLIEEEMIPRVIEAVQKEAQGPIAVTQTDSP